MKLTVMCRGRKGKRRVQDGDAFIFINRNCTSMKILHVECGGLVIYHLKLEQGFIHLPDMSVWDGKSSIPTAWTDLVMMVEGIYPDSCKRQDHRKTEEDH